MQKRFSAFLLSALAVSFPVLVGAARADEPMQGSFTAHEACPALQSIHKQTNPGDIKLEPSHGYRLLAKNKPDATYYRVDVEGAAPRERWVPVGCGDIGAANGNASAPAPVPAAPGAARGENGRAYVLAVSWQSAFCEGLPDKTECRTQTADRFDATHFTLHGLWPQPRRLAYCGVPQSDVEADRSKQWANLPQPQLQPATRQALEQAMPGTASFLDRHEWTEHGSCFFEKSAEAYFSREIALIGQLNASPVQKLFADNIGREIQGRAIRAAFDQAFGVGAGDRVRIACKRDGNRRLIVEMTIGLRGDVGDNPSLATLIAGASPTDAGCNAGLVDQVGLQ